MTFENQFGKIGTHVDAPIVAADDFTKRIVTRERMYSGELLLVNEPRRNARIVVSVFFHFFFRGGWDIGKRMQFCYNMERERETMGVVRDCVGGYTDR